MIIPYIPAGEDLGAAHWAPLWAEFDRKMGLLLDGKSPGAIGDNGDGPFGPDLGLTTGSGGIIGKVFYFLGANARAGFPASYNHATYTAVANALVETPPVPFFRDPVKKTTQTNEAIPPLTGSLEAHKRDVVEDDGTTAKYFIWPENVTMPEKRYRYAVAELVFEGFGTTFLFPAEWDKYNFFRLHNLSTDHALTVTFATAGFQVLIPPMSCRCVRRDSVTAGYDASYRYFWAVKPNDARFLQQADFLPSEDKSVYATMQVNNVCNPAVLFKWIQLFETGVGAGASAVKWFRDPHAVYDLGDYHGKFGDPAKAATIVGDLIHHKGNVRYYSQTFSGAREIKFDGYATWKANLQAVGLDLTDTGDNVKISAPGGGFFNELVSYGTNLLQKVVSVSAYAPATSVSVNVPYAIDARWPDQNFQNFFVIGFNVTGEDAQWQDGNFNLFSAHRDITHLEHWLTAQTSAPPAMKIWKDTVEQVCRLTNFIAADDPPKTYYDFENARFVMTIFGPELHYDFRVSLRARCADLYADILSDPLLRFDSGSVVQKRVIKWPAVGWGTTDEPGFFSPRLARKYSARPLSGELYWRHPDIINEVAGAGGADFDLESIGESYLDSEVTALCPAKMERASSKHEVGPDNFGVWNNPDDLYEATTAYQSITFTKPLVRANDDKTRPMPRVYLLIEIYNTMAAWINALIWAQPITFQNSRFYIAPNTSGGFGSFGGGEGLDPKDLYCWVAGPVPGITSSVAVAPPTAGRNVSWNASFGPGQTTGVVTTAVDHGDSDSLAIGAIGVASGRYLSIANVQAYAESKGFKFRYENSAVLRGLTLIEAGVGKAELKFGEPAGYGAGGALPTYAVFSSEAADLKWKLGGNPQTLKLKGDPGTKLYITAAGNPEENVFRMELVVGDPVTHNAVGSTISDAVWREKKAFVQNYVSGGFTVLTKAILTPNATFKHSTDDFAGSSWENAYSFALAQGGALPMAVEGSDGPATIRPLTAGDNTVVAADPEDELVVRFGNYVSLA